MDEKNESKTPLEEFKKLANDFRDVVTELGDILTKILPDIEIPEEEEDTWKMKRPYEYGDEVCLLDSDGEIISSYWDCRRGSFDIFNQGNIFSTGQAAELEAKRRNLLTRFRAFRDECNGDWKVDWNKRDDKYYLYLANECKEIVTTSISLCEAFPLFGYFKNEQDAERAIELFGDEIIELYVNNEV